MASTPGHPPFPPDPPVIRPSAGALGRSWKWLRYVLGLGVAGLAVWAVTGKSDELSGASQYLLHLRWEWAVVAAVAEALSYMSFAAMQRRLLGAGNVAIPMASMTGITVAGNAIQNSLPAGVVLSAAYSYRQYRRWGADEVLAAWVVVAMAGVTLVSLAALAAIGLAMAASTGSALDLVGAIVGVTVVAAVVVAAWAKRTFLIAHAVRLVRLSQRFLHRPAGDAHEVVAGAIERMSRVAPSKRQWAWATCFAMGNWLADLACLTISFLAVGAGVPWDGLLLAYTAAQLATNLPITPGGLGVVEGSLTVALVAFGGGQASTVAAVLVYRVLNYWLMLPVGWGAWAVIALKGRRHAVKASAEPLAAAVPEGGAA
ncbi:MAG TPA: YbhN family protein [Acidimicrobiales bacterium]|jgi:hypothetical protein|nr:YbhN family protein [Acidimicrobiales bacterium]